ncbi:hypothetical protein STEG23_023369 [Scotinomys teguina]
MAAAVAPYITRTSCGSSSLHHADITRITRTSRAAALRHHAAAAHSSALQVCAYEHVGNEITDMHCQIQLFNTDESDVPQKRVVSDLGFSSSDMAKHTKVGGRRKYGTRSGASLRRKLKSASTSSPPPPSVARPS